MPLPAVIAKARKHVTTVKRGSGWYISRPDRVADLDGKIWVIEADSAAKARWQAKLNQAIFALHFLGLLDHKGNAAAQQQISEKPTIALRDLVKWAAERYGT